MTKAKSVQRLADIALLELQYLGRGMSKREAKNKAARCAATRTPYPFGTEQPEFGGSDLDDMIEARYDSCVPPEARSKT